VAKLITLFVFLLLTNLYCTQANAAIEKLKPTKPRAITTIVKQDIVVAVIDTGIDLQHPDLKTNLWVNSGEIGVDKNGKSKAVNGLDDDNNGYIDDVHGWNFIQENHDLNDSIGHGTHISGIIAGKSIPQALAADFSRIRLMTLKYYDKNMDDTESINYTVKAIRYAIRMGANVINYSSSGAVKSRLEEAVIREATKKGILFVTAAGNSGLNLDKYDYYPANYAVKNVFSVSAIDSQSRLIASSNYGGKSIPAPGKSIYSTVPGGGYGNMSGTSQATAFISNKIADLLIHGNQSIHDVITKLYSIN
jgi:subtilisin family serine protease